MKTLDHGNQVLTFFLELAVYASVVTWAWSTSFATGLRVGLAIAGVLAMAVAWGLFAAPKASVPLHGAGLVVFEVAWFGVGVGALHAAGLRQWAFVVVVVVVANGALRAAFA